MTDNDRLREILRRHDPARGSEGLPEEDRVRLRRAIVSAAAERRPAPAFPRLVLAGVFTALALGAGLGLWSLLRPAPRTATSDDAAVIRTAGAPARREVHIVTPGGTQVVWVLDSEFRL